MITSRIHISVPDYQNANKLGILRILVKLFICPRGLPFEGAGQKLFVLHVIFLYPPRDNTGIQSALIKRTEKFLKATQMSSPEKTKTGVAIFFSFFFFSFLFVLLFLFFSFCFFSFKKIFEVGQGEVHVFFHPVQG